MTGSARSLNAIDAQVLRISMVEDEGKRQLSCESVGVGTDAMEHIVASL